MTQQHALLQAVIESPNDDARWLAYADWLDGQGDPRGELIRLDVQLKSLPPYDPNEAPLSEILFRKGLSSRQSEFAERHRTAWAGLHLQLTNAHWGYHHWFVDFVGLEGEEAVKQFIGQADGVFASAPLLGSMSLHDEPALWDYPEGTDKGSPSVLVRNALPISLPTLEAFLALPHLARLTSLWLRQVECKSRLREPAQQLLRARFGEEVFSGRGRLSIGS